MNQRLVDFGNFLLYWLGTAWEWLLRVIGDLVDMSGFGWIGFLAGLAVLTGIWSLRPDRRRR